MLEKGNEYGLILACKICNFIKHYYKFVVLLLNISYLCDMERKIRAYKNYFIDFIKSLSDIESKKVFYVLDMLQWLSEEISKDTSKRNRAGKETKE